MSYQELLSKYELPSDLNIIRIIIENRKKQYIIKYEDIYYLLTNEDMIKTTYNPKPIKKVAKKSKLIKKVKNIFK